MRPKEWLTTAGQSGDRIPVGVKTCRTRSDRSWVPPSLMYNEQRVSCLGVQRPGPAVNHSPLPSAEVKEGVELYLYSESGLSWPVKG